MSRLLHSNYFIIPDLDTEKKENKKQDFNHDIHIFLVN